MTTIADVFARKLRQARVARGLTQGDLAAALRAEASWVSKAESGQGGVSSGRVCELALALGVETSDLLPTLEEMREIAELAWVRPVDPKPISTSPTGKDYVEAVVEGARKYQAEHGSAPKTVSGPATDYVGFATTWTAIDSALRKGSNGVNPCGGLRDLLCARGVVLAGKALEDAIEAGAREYRCKHGLRPTKQSGDAEPYVGTPGSWSLWDKVLRQGQRGTTCLRTLHEFLDDRKVPRSPRAKRKDRVA